MIRVVAGSGNEGRAAGVLEDLKRAGVQAESGMPQKGDVVVAVLGTVDSKSVPAAVLKALDLSLHMVIVRTEPFQLPKLINHLRVIDITSPTYRDELVAATETLSAPDAGLALKVLTPNAKRSNRSAGVVVAIIAIFMFAVGIYGVAVLNLEAPVDEYAAVDTAAAMTIQFYVGPELQYFATWLPRSPEDEANFEATLQQLPTAYRPLMGLTMTQYAQGTPMPTIAPTMTPE